MLHRTFKIPEDELVFLFFSGCRVAVQLVKKKKKKQTGRRRKMSVRRMPVDNKNVTWDSYDSCSNATTLDLFKCVNNE